MEQAAAEFVVSLLKLDEAAGMVCWHCVVAVVITVWQFAGNGVARPDCVSRKG